MINVVIVGAGPSGIFTALELIKNDKNKYKITILEEGKPIEERNCPKAKTGECVHCRCCSITSGFSGAGAFSDGKLSLSHNVGGDLPELISSELCDELIKYVDDIYLSFGADEKVEGSDETDAIHEIRRKAISAGLKLVDCPIRHLGTEKAHELYYKIEQYLIENGVKIITNVFVDDIILNEDGECIGAKYHNYNHYEIYADKLILATGRKGADWLNSLCRFNGIQREPGNMDIGVRVEVRNEVMKEINENLYEAKLIGWPEPFKDKCRTFCQNPGGFVAQESYDNNLVTVNGHSFKDEKSNNTNLAILCTHHFTEPFDDPIDYAKKIGELTNALGDGKLLVQRLGDIKNGKRTWQKELNRTNVKPTLDAVAGDITSAFPYRTMTDILGFIEMMDKVAPGFASDETLLYAPEIKFYSNRISMDKDLKTNIKNLYCLGDASGWTRGLMMASVMGVHCARCIIKGE